MKYYTSKNTEVVEGPFTKDQITTLVRSGVLKKSHYLMQEGGKWHEVGSACKNIYEKMAAEDRAAKSMNKAKKDQAKADRAAAKAANQAVENSAPTQVAPKQPGRWDITTTTIIWWIWCFLWLLGCWPLGIIFFFMTPFFCGSPGWQGGVQQQQTIVNIYKNDLE